MLDVDKPSHIVYHYNLYVNNIEISDSDMELLILVYGMHFDRTRTFYIPFKMFKHYIYQLGASYKEIEIDLEGVSKRLYDYYKQFITYNKKVIQDIIVQENPIIIPIYSNDFIRLCVFSNYN